MALTVMNAPWELILIQTCGITLQSWRIWSFRTCHVTTMIAHDPQGPVIGVIELQLLWYAMQTAPPTDLNGE